MAATTPTPLAIGAACRVLATGERPTEDRLVVVDLDSKGDRSSLIPPALLPAVTIGISEHADHGTDLDIAITRRAHPPAPWVHVPDLGGALEGLATAVASHPQAAVALMHVLRGGGADLERDLAVESLAYSTLQGGPEHAAWLASRPTKSRPPEPAAPITLARHGSELVLTLNRPHVRNAYSAAMRDALCEALTLAVIDGTVTSVRLLGAGPDFCSGGDLNEFGTRPDPATAHLIRTERSAARLLAVIADRVSVRLHGACVGAGIELSAVAGRVEADPDTTIRLPEVAMGLIPGAGGTATLPRRIGRGRTGWLALTGQPIDAVTAHRWGLVDQLTG